MNKIPLIIITGPTAVGKTELSINIAKKLNAEIISADSMQIYKYMDIGSAKITNVEMCGIKHYLIDEVNPDYHFSVSEFQTRAFKYIKEITEKNKKVIVTGGTGLYLNSLIYDMDFANSNANLEIREALQRELSLKGQEFMHEKLKKLNKEVSERIHKNNVKRVLRALEVELVGNKMNDFSKDLKYNESYYPLIVILNRDREKLYEKINLRVDLMFKNGLVNEVKKLIDMGYKKDLISMQGIGYKEVIKYLTGEYSIEETIEIIKRNSRRYAKRQLTWFRRYKDAFWFELDLYENKPEDLEKEIFGYIEKKLCFM